MHAAAPKPPLPPGQAEHSRGGGLPSQNISRNSVPGVLEDCAHDNPLAHPHSLSVEAPALAAKRANAQDNDVGPL